MSTMPMRKPRFSRETSQVEAPPSLPSLDKLPTNVFVENFLHENGDDDDAFFKLVKSKSEKVKDEDEETVLELEDTKERDASVSPDFTPEFAYQKACKKFGVRPCSKLARIMNDEEQTCCDLGHYNLTGRECKAILFPLAMNSRITTLNLQGNNLGAGGITLVEQLMRETETIKDLDLSENNLRSKGAAKIKSILESNKTIEVLKLSGNGFCNSDAATLAKSIEVHPSLIILDLSHNNFGEGASEHFRNMISENSTLQELNLSWNNFRGKGAMSIARGVKGNVGLRVVNLAWNGFGEEATVELAKGLSSTTITRLNLTCNRVGEKGFITLLRGLKDNDHLKVLTLSRNPIPEEAVLIGLEILMADECCLEQLDLTEMLYGSALKAKIDEVKMKFTSFNCSHGYSDLYGKRRIKQYDVVEEAMMEIAKYCQKHKIKIVDLFARFDADGSMSVSHEEFKIGLKEAKVPVSDEQINALIRELDQDGDGEIDFSEVVMYMSVNKPAT